MKRTAAILTLLCFSLAACAKDEGGTPEEARDALPSVENMQIHLPEMDGAAKPDVGEVSGFYLVTLGTALNVNLSVGYGLLLVRLVTLLPVTSIEDDTLIWGPWNDNGHPGEYRLTARLDGGSWHWALEGRRVGTTAAFVTIVDGIATPGRPHRGSGEVTIDLDAALEIDPATDGQGVVTIEYDLESEPRTLVVDGEALAPMPSGGTALASFHYTYAENADGSGELGFAVYGDTDDPQPGWEMSDFVSQWRADGAGRADAEVTGGDMGSGSATATECWSSAFLVTYYTDSVAWMPTQGDPSSCAF